MNRRAAKIAVFASMVAGLGFSRGAEAQLSPSLVARPILPLRTTYEGLPSRSPEGSDGGISLSESAILHMGIGTELGYDTNVFFQSPNETQVESPILRVLPYLELTNRGRDGSVPSGAHYFLAANLLYRHYLTDNEDVIRYGNDTAFMPSIGGAVDFRNGQAMTFGLSNFFNRFEEPPFNPLQPPFIRNTNQFSAFTRFSPGGGRLELTLRYLNRLDLFAEPANSPRPGDITQQNTMLNEVMLDVAWRWLPKTSIYLQARQGYLNYVNATSALGTSDAFPLRALFGLRGLVTPKTTVNLSVGYMNPFYVETRARDTGVLGNLAMAAQVNYSPTALNQVSLGYQHDFENAVFGNYFYSDLVFATFQQTVASRFVFRVAGMGERRGFEDLRPQDEAGTDGPGAGFAQSARVDYLVRAGAVLDYYVHRWMYAGVGYSLAFNESDFGQNVDFFKQQGFLRLGITY